MAKASRCEKALDGVFRPEEINQLHELIDGFTQEGMDATEARMAGAQEFLRQVVGEQLEIDALVREATGMPQYVQPPRPAPQAEVQSDSLPPEGSPRPRTKEEKRGLPPALEAKMIKKSVQQMRAELQQFLGRATVRALESAGILILDKSRRIKTDQQGNKRAVQGAYDPGKGTIRLYGGTQHVDRSTVGVMMHEGSHSGMDRILGGQLAEFVHDIIKQAAAGNELAIDALIKAKAAQMEPEQVFANNRTGHVAREEIVAYYVQNSVDSGIQSGISRRLMNRMKARFSLSPFGKAARAVGVKVELTPEMAVEYAKEAVRDTLETVEVLNQLKRAVAAKSGKGGSINSSKKPSKGQLESATAIVEGMPGPAGEELALRETGIRFVNGEPVVSVNADTVLMKDRVNKERARTLEDVLEDNDLFAAYPELKNYPVSYSRLEGTAATRINDTIFIDSRATDPAEVRSAVLAQLDEIMADQDGWVGFEGDHTPGNYDNLGKLYANADNALIKREIKRLMTDPAAAAITEGVLESSTSKATPGADLGRLAQLLGPKLYGDKSQITNVSTKELFQNAFDAVRAEVMAGNIESGKIDIMLDPDNRSIRVIDNGPGMDVNQINNAFLKIAGTDKKGEISSGGLGIAKMLFLFGNERIRLSTIKDGVEHRLESTGEQLMESFKNPDIAPEIVSTPTDAPNGTEVYVEIPESFQDAATGKTKDIYFPGGWQLREAPPAISQSPLFQDIEVSFNGKVQDVGANFPTDDFVPFSTVKFEWGSADIIIEKDDNEQHDDNIIILSNGLQQFGMKLKENPFEMYSKLVPKKVFIDIHPRVKPEEEGYPFDLNRQRFSPAVEESMNQIISYLSVLYGGSQAAETAAGFGEIEFVNADGSVSEPMLLAPEVKENTLKGMLKVDKKSRMEVKDGKLTLNGKVLPELTAEDIGEVRIDLEQFKISQSEVDPAKPMIHNNMQAKISPELVALAQIKKEYEKVSNVNGDLRNEWRELDRQRDKWMEEKGDDAYGDPEYEVWRKKVDDAYDRYMENNKKSDALYEQRREAERAADEAEHEMVPLLQHLREKFGEEKVNKYLGGLGKAFMEVRDAVIRLDPENYDTMAQVPVGTSFDQEYYGVHVWVPFEGMFINPGTAVFVDPERAGMAMYMTMVHEIAHFRSRGHDASFVSELQRLTTLLEAGGLEAGALKNRISNFVEYNHDIFSYIHEEIKNGTLENIGKRFSEPSYDQRFGGNVDDVARAWETARGLGFVEGTTGAGFGDIRAIEQRYRGLERNGGPRTVDELESAYNETSAAAGDILNPRLLEAIGLPEPGAISREAPTIDMSEGNLLGQVMADPNYVKERIALAVGPELESAADDYVEAYAAEQRILEEIYAAASNKAGHTVNSLDEAQRLLGEDALEAYHAASAETTRSQIAVLTKTDDDWQEMQDTLKEIGSQQEAREAYFKQFPLSNFNSLQDLIDVLDAAGIPEDAYLYDEDKVILVEGIPIILEVMEADTPGAITVAFRSLQDRLLRRDGYERQLYFRNPTAALRKIVAELFDHSAKVAPKLKANKIIFAPSNDARQSLYKRGLKKLGVPFILHKSNFLMDLPEQRVLDNLRQTVADTPLESATDTEEFRNWFGQSKVLDAAGKPKRVFHGSPIGKPFDMFKKGDQFPNEIYFTDDPVTAEIYTQLPQSENESHTEAVNDYLTELIESGMSEKEARAQGGQIIPTYLRIENPIVLDFEGKAWSYERYDTALRRAVENGNDGLIVKNVQETETEGLVPPATSYIVFNPNQIKSALANSGAFDPDSVNILESSTEGPIDLNEVREERRKAKELDNFAQTMREQIRNRAQEFAKAVEAAGHLYKPGDIVILNSGRRARIISRTLVPDQREPLPPYKEYKARQAEVKKRPLIPGYRMEYGDNGDLHVSDIAEWGIREPFTGPREFESAATLVDSTKSYLWKDRTKPEEAHHLGLLQRFLVNYYDDTWTMESKNEAVWDRYDLSKSRRSAMIDEINRNFVEPMKGLVRATGLTLKEVDDWLAARHIVEDNVNRNLAERASLHYINKLVKHLDKPTRLDLVSQKEEIMKQDVSPKRIREQMYALMNEFAEYEKTSFDQRSGTTRQAVKEEWEDFKRHASGMYDARSGLENRGEAMDAAEMYNRHRDNARMQKVAELYDAMTTEHLNILLEGGTITQQEYDALLGENPHYVPLRRESFDYETQFSFLKEFGSGPAKGVTVRGGSADVDAPIHIMQNTFARMHMAAGHAQRNLANNFLYEQIMQNRQNWTGWFTVNEDNTRDRHTQLGFVVEGGTAALDNTDMIVLRNGKRLIIKPIKQNERARVFAAAANRLGSQEVSGVFKIFGWVNSIVRFTAVSASPSFLLANLIRDPLTAMYNMQATEAEAYTKQIRQNYKPAFKALIEVYVKGNRDPNSAAVQMVERFEKAGGKISFTQSLKEMDNSWSSFEKEMWAEGQPGIKHVLHLFKQIENTNIAIENVMRLATFDVLHSQIGQDKAARIAKDLTTNFDRRGFKSSAMGLLYLFFNATIQGNAQVIRNLSKSKKLQHMVGGTIVMAALFDLIGRALSDDDEYGNSEWDKITGKDRNIVLPIPINGVYIRIPAPWVYNVVWRFGGMLSETAAGARSAVDTASETAAMVLTAFNPMGGGTVAQALTPTALDPVMQVIENRDFAGNQLRPVNFPGASSKPDSELAWQSTPEEYKWLARQMNSLTGGDVAHSGWIDVAPSTIQNTVNFLGGGLVRFSTNVLSIPKDLATKELELKNVPIIRQLTTSPGTSIDTQQYYDKVAKVYAAEKAVKDYGRGDTLDLQRQKEAKKEYAKELRMVNHVKDVERQIKSLRTRMKAAQGRGNKVKAEEYKKRIQSVQRRFIATYESRMR